MGLEKSTELMDDTLAAFRSKLENKSAQVGVIGLGYVGLPLALLFARNGGQGREENSRAQGE